MNRPLIDLSQLVTAEQKQAQAMAELSSTFERAIQGHLDTEAANHGYDNILTAVSYADEPTVVRFQEEGLAFRVWRSRVWAYAYEGLAAVEAGRKETPDLATFLAELPALELRADG